MDKATLQLSQYCDNDLSADEQIEFESWLRADSAHVDRFVRATQLNSLLDDLIKEQSLQSTAWSHTLKDSDPFNAPEKSESASFARSSRIGLFVAAAVLFGVVTSVFTVPLFKFSTLVAQVTSLQGHVVTANGQPALVGSLLVEGESLEVKSGQVLVTFECGAKALIEGPALFVVEGPRSGSLINGMVSARVPTQAIGFAIETPLLKVVDLGTEFLIRIIDAEQLDLHVFDGLVEVQLADKFKHVASGPLQFSEGRSERFDLGANTMYTLDYDESLKREF